MSKKLYGVFKFSPIGDTCLGIYDSLEKIEKEYGKTLKELKGIDKEISGMRKIKNAWIMEYWDDKNNKYIAEIELNKEIYIG